MKFNMDETWRTIDGFSGFYQVSNLGRIRSVDRKIYNKGCCAWQEVKGCILKPTYDKGGYTYVGLHDNSNGKTKTFKTHRLVALYFIEGFEDGLEVNHKNGVRDDNRAENLEWCTRSGNMLDRYKRGYNPTGEKNNSAKLKNDYIPIITTLYDSGVPQGKIAKAFNVSQGTISHVIRRRHYKEVII